MAPLDVVLGNLLVRRRAVLTLARRSLGTGW
jgi:hypothetical protein